MDNNYKIKLAEHDDVLNWMKLVDIVKDNFPGLVMYEYQNALVESINNQSAICVKQQNEIVGVLLFSTLQKCLSCMAVHPNHRKQGIASRMIRKMISLFPEHSEIFVSTFREGDPNGIAPRALYKKLGFVEDELTIEFGYPCQKFVFHKI